ncbi:RHS repeat-associated core domain-containing protein [Petroclostridium sp. X23]|uniref:RHS repeat-associated core domain-containing protein n=1 Tax=Petroclostridium sp. X23 TaxID=3045146 RepID=UPI0024AE2756|nr:RHS repeat-associated core domain-containing protein [Petroclostridium sp. X23]WHH58413.1 RHS repeat-associated core domain-containing protein [Petroclostridium sp. X23]
MKNRYGIALILSILFILFSNITAYAADDMQDKYNNEIYRNAAYQKGIAPPFEQNNDIEEHIDPLTGDLQIKQTDLHLPGKNGLDLDITRFYSSSQSNTFETCVNRAPNTNSKSGYYVSGYIRYDIWENGQYIYGFTDTYTDEEYFQDEYSALQKANGYNNLPVTWEFDYPEAGYDCRIEYINFSVHYAYPYYDYTDGLYDQKADDRFFGIGKGWAFDFPYIEAGWDSEALSWSAGYKYLHFGSAGVWQFSMGSSPSNLLDYPLTDMVLTTDPGTYSNGQMSSSYVLTKKEGKKYYFGIDGRLLGIKDRFGNEIKFQHYIRILRTPTINKIIDSVGREINITYNRDSSVNITVTDATNPQNNKQIIYYKQSILGHSSRFALTKVTDALGRNTLYEYNYHEQEGARSSLLKRNFSTMEIVDYPACLSKITYPTGGKSYYNYQKYQKNCGSEGAMEFYKVIERYDAVKENEQKLNQRSFQYKYGGTPEYDGYPSYYSPTNFPQNFTVKTRMLDGEGNSEIYTYNYKKLCTNILKEGVNHKSEIINEFDNIKKVLKKTVTKIFNKSTGQFMNIIENYDYNDFRDLVGYWGAQASRDANGTPANDEQKITCEYDGTYHFLTQKSYKKDAGTTVKEKYIPITDGGAGINRKAVRWAEGYENDVLKNKAWYNYDTYGNIIEERTFLENWTDYIANKYSYDDDNAARNGKFNGLYLTRKWTEGVKDADGNLVQAAAGNSAGIIDARYKYDWFGNVTEEQDRVGNRTAYTYDKLGRILKKTNTADGSYREWVYADIGENSVTVTDENWNKAQYAAHGGKAQYVYDSLGKLIREKVYTTNPATNTKELVAINEYTYDTQSRLKKKYNPSTGTTTEYFYYSDGRVQKSETTQIKNGVSVLLNRETYTYDNANNNGTYAKTTKIAEGDSNSPSIVTTAYADTLGRTVKTGRMYNGVEYADTYQYDYAGNKVQEKSARAYQEGWAQPYTAQYNYDHSGKVIKITDLNGNMTTTTYDTLGRVKTVTDAKGNQSNPKYSTLYEYDAMGRLIQERIPFQKDANGTIHYTIKKHYYDRNNNIIREKISINKPGESEKYKIIDYEYDPLNRLVKVITYKDQNTVENYTQYYYDAAGNRLRMYTGLNKPLTINGLDNVTSGGDDEYKVTKYEYDNVGNIIKETNPSGKHESYTYNLNNQVIEKTDRVGNTIDYTYDGLGRMLTRNAATINGAGNGAYAYTYTLTGNRMSVTEGQSSTTYYYDSLGRLINETASNGSTKEYAYDMGDNRKSFTLKQNSIPKLQMSYQYDNLNRMHQVYESSALIATYSYDQNGNRKTLTYPNQITADYTYNLANRLINLANKKGQQVLSQFAYTYYLDGNQESKTDHAGVKTSYIYDGLGRLENEAVDGEMNAAYTYDDNSNRQSMTVTGMAAPFSTGTESAVYEYNGFSELTKAVQGNKTVTYAYNGDGLRTSKTVNGVTIHHIWDGTDIIAEADPSLNITQKYIRGIDLITQDINGVRNYILRNGHGDVVQLTDASGNVIKNYDYDAFGNEKNPDPNDTNVFRYAGEMFDKETGTYYLRARYYDPTIGRFISEDSYEGQVTDPLSLNLYTYCLNNPILYTDPSGHMPLADPNVWIQAGNSLQQLWISTQNLWYTYAPQITEGLQQAGNWAVQHGPQFIEGMSETGKNIANKIKEIAGSGNSSNLDPNNFDPNKWKEVADLSKKALKHPLNDHMPSKYAKQALHQSKEAVEQYLSKKSFFNPNWSEQQITQALNSAYKDAVNKGITNGYHTIEAYGEKVQIFIRDGNFSTGFGTHSLTYEQLIKLAK